METIGGCRIKDLGTDEVLDVCWRPGAPNDSLSRPGTGFDDGVARRVFWHCFARLLAQRRGALEQQAAHHLRLVVCNHQLTTFLEFSVRVRDAVFDIGFVEGERVKTGADVRVVVNR